MEAHFIRSSESWGFPGGTGGKNLPTSEEDQRDMGWIPGLERSLEEGMAIHSSILAWRIPRTEEPGRLQTLGSQRVRHDWSDLASMQWILTYPLCMHTLLYLWICSASFCPLLHLITEGILVSFFSLKLLISEKVNKATKKFPLKN